MSDGIAPAVDKVGAAEPTVPEAQAAASTMDTTKDGVAICPPGPPEKDQGLPVDAPKPSEESKSSEVKVTDAPASAAAHIIPKPVEIQSVPETPVREASPVNGPPRPELNLTVETEDAEKNKEDEVPPGVLEPLLTPTASIPSTDEPVAELAHNGAPKPAETRTLQKEESEKRSESTETGNGTGEKRKLDDSLDDESDEQSQDKPDIDEAERADKKAKIDAVESKTNGGPTKGKPGRPRKDKSAPPVIGKTARKTRSQGPVEV